MRLTQALVDLCQGLRDTFPQQRTADRASSLLVAALLCAGRKWITRVNCVRNREQVDWSADYKLFSRSKWNASDLFVPVIKATEPYFGDGPILLAGDETRARRGGRKVKRSRWTRDPMSPPFHVNFMKGIRFVQFSALLPLYKTHDVGARAVPISFSPVDLPPKPRSNASPQQKAQYKEACKEHNMCKHTVRQLGEIRRQYDKAGAAHRLLLVGLDGGFCNRKIFGASLDRTVIIARGRKDAVLCRAANDPARPRKVYGDEKFTPEEIRQDQSIPWQETSIFYGGKIRAVRYKQVTKVLWQGGARRKPLRIIVVAPIGYQLSPGMPKYYRKPAYLFVDDQQLECSLILQCYFDRWQIEVNHRDEKQDIGIVDAQVWNDQSVDRVPAFMVAAYALLILASLTAFGPQRTDAYMQPPKWQKRRRQRPSCLDLLAKLREEARDYPEDYETLEFKPDLERILLRAA